MKKSGINNTAHTSVSCEVSNLDHDSFVYAFPEL